jgi:MoaA/NifB/PqqE/SkfB family radical SAM enzyme
MAVSPTHAIVAVTNRCNARCVMCDIWKGKAGKELRPEDYAKLPPSLREINVTGGEPLLRTDLAEVMAVMQQRCPHARLVLSTNGLLPDRLRPLLESAGRIAVRISVDGLGELHDTIRGIAGAYDKAMESLEICRQAGVEDLGLSATMTRYNAGKVKDIQDFAQEQGLEFVITVAHSSPFFFGDQRGEEPDPETAVADMKAMRGRLYGSANPKEWFRGYYVSGLIDLVRGSPRPIVCHAARDFFYMDPEGNVYPCHILDKKMGNILDKTVEQMIEDDPSVLRAVQSCRQRCWMTCTVAPEMRRKLPLYAARVGWAKAGHHLRSLFGVK